VLATIGDLVEDVVVHLGGPIHVASDTTVVVHRRRGGSAANMAATTARLGHPVRFIGQVGDDGVGERITSDLAACGVDLRVRRQGRSGTVVVLVDQTGERTMLADRAACTELDAVDPSWLDGVDTLHVPVYSLAVDPLAGTAAALIHLAHQRGVRVSIDASSVSVMESYGIDALVALLRSLTADVLLCNEDEAACLGEAAWPDALGGTTVVVKHGAGPAGVREPGRPEVAVAAHRLVRVTDTTGAGDAFAAGYLVARSAGATHPEAAQAGHDAAAELLALTDR
jgi:sugar/nucleoside kinase (ribokinase family)